jgi:hypothetical protein
VLHAAEAKVTTTMILHPCARWSRQPWPDLGSDAGVLALLEEHLSPVDALGVA